jgi:hypothetical protein
MKTLDLAIAFAIPIRLKNPLNSSLGNTRWSGIARAREHKAHHASGLIHARGALARYRVRAVDLIPAIVIFTRISAGRLDDDNLAAACKYVRDGVAEALGIDDGGSAVQWRYAQRKGPAKHYALHVRIERF